MATTSATATLTFDGEPDVIWRRVVQAELPTVMTGRGLLPAIVDIHDQEGPWGDQGQTRKLILADGNSLQERILTSEPPHLLRYELFAIRGFFGVLTSGAEGSFELKPIANQQVEVKWCYRYHARYLILWPWMFFIIRFFWEPYMAQVLTNVRKLGAE